MVGCIHLGNMVARILNQIHYLGQAMKLQPVVSVDLNIPSIAGDGMDFAKTIGSRRPIQRLNTLRYGWNGLLLR